MKAKLPIAVADCTLVQRHKAAFPVTLAQKRSVPWFRLIAWTASLPALSIVSTKAPRSAPTWITALCSSREMKEPGRLASGSCP